MAIVLPWEHLVCEECLKQNTHSLWLVKYKCFGGHTPRRFVTVVIDNENTALVKVRSHPSTMMNFHGRFYMCNHYHCRNGRNCVYAHTDLELDKWNATKSILESASHLRTSAVHAHPPSQVCSTCFTNNPHAVWLTWLTCSKHDQGTTVMVVISNDRSRLVKVREPPRSVRQLTPDQIKQLRCHADCGRSCSTPHSEEERAYWLWKVVKEKMSQTIRMLGDVTFLDMCQKYSYPENHEQLLGPADPRLSCDNYKGKYHKLVYLDNLAHAQKMIDDCDGLLEVSSSREYGNLDHNQVHIVEMQSTAMDYVAQNTPPCTVSIRAGDRVFTGRIAYKAKQTLVVELDQHAVSGLQHKPFVHFEYNHWYFWRLHRAIEHASPALIQRLVEPSESRYLPPAQRRATTRKLRGISIDNEYQSRALRKMLLCRPGCPFLLMGPFGTGKTHLLVTSITKLVLAGGNTILVCAHQNNGANHICRSLLDLNILDRRTITRLYPDKKRGDLPGVVCLSIYDDNAVSILAQKQVIITTFMTALRLKEQDRQNHLQFSQIIIDEGAQSREPEALGALLMASEGTHIVIAGDNKQVGPAVSVLSDLASERGLGESLLERLLTLYQSRYDKRQLNYHRHSLLTNYRCHPSILMLASSLFYECTLLSRSNSQPHPNAPYPLVFQCSSMQQRLKDSSTVNRAEAELLISKVLEFIEAWPTTTDPKAPKPRIAILAGSAGQVNALRTCMRQTPRDRVQNVDIDITYTYTIQGSEFDAVFLSTHEPTDKEGKPLNMVRSICNDYVFNTVITRSRSLVFAVGNPFRLVQMGKHFNVQCWAEFIQRTITCQSFYLPQSNDTQAQDLPKLVSTLTESVLPCALFKDLKEPDDSSDCDDIVTNYIKLLDMRPERFRGIKLVQDPKKDVKAWQTEEVVENQGIVLAELDLRNHRKGVVKVHNAPQIHVSSTRDRRCLFPGDEVPVDPKTNEIAMNSKYEQKFNETHFGKSIVCRVNPRSMIEFMPLDKRYPKLVNLPSLTKYDRDGVTCFEPSSLNDRIKVCNFIPKDQAAKMVFVVKVLRWTMKFPYPLGIAVGALPCGGCVYSGDLLLKVAHHIPMDDCSSSEQHTPPVHKNPQRLFDKDVITIDPQGSLDHDDALSCVHVESHRDGTHEYEIGVHITDVQKFVPRDSQLDESARQRGTSVYSSTAQCVSHMLPEQLVQEASIAPGKTRDTFSVVAKVSVKERKVVGEIHSIEFLKSQVVSSKELTYEGAQTSILAKRGSRPIKALWAVACHLRQRRLGQTPATHIQMRRADEMLCPEAHMLVEEFMIWANQEVANYLLDFSPTILRHQPAPNEAELKALVSAHGHLMAVSPDLRQHIPPEQRAYVCVQMLHETLREMEEELKNGHVRKALHMIQFEHLQPQVAVAHALYRQICQQSAYCIAENVDDFRHDGLQCDQYTRFTSPIRRYIDLVVQRMLHSALVDEPNPYTDETEEVEEICRDMKERERVVSRYEDDRRNLELGCELQQSSREYVCFVKKIEEGELYTVFHDPSLKLGPMANIPLKHLNAKKIPQKESSPEPDSTDSVNPQHCVWQVKMTAGNTKPRSFLSNPGLQHDSRSKADAQIVFFTPEQPDHLETSSLQESTVNAAIKPLTRDIPKENWEQLQTYALAHPTHTDAVKKLLHGPTLQQDSNFPTIPHSPLWVYKFHRPLQSCEVLRVQLTGCFNSTKQMITPAVQLVEVGPNLRVCIQHNSNPTECFTDTSLSKHPKNSHTSLKRYIQFWERALLAEAAAASVTDAELLIIRDIRVVWPELKEVTDSQGQVYYQLPDAGDSDPPEDCFACVKLSKSFILSSYEFFHINSGDLVCLRYCESGRSDGVRGVLHMVVHFTTEESSEEEEVSAINVYLKFVGERPNYISKRMKAALSKLSYEIQLIPLSLPLRRIYSSLKKLDKPYSSGLSSRIALGKAHCDKSVPSIHKVLSKDELRVATTLWTDRPNPSKLNKYQQKAIELACGQKFVMIQGPPGTGKSVTGAHIAYALAMKLRKEVGKVRKKENEPNPCVMYCGPSQQSVNVVLEILVSSAEVRNSGLKIVRVYSSAIESKDFQGPKFNSLVFSPLKVDGKCKEKFREYALHYLVRERSQEIVLLDEEFEQLKSAKKVPGPSKRGAYRSAVSRESIEVLKHDVDIVLCTCNEAGSHRIIKSVTPTYCIIDECAMATEPECMVAIRRAENVVLIGDDKQLQPVIQNKDAARMGMGTSLFERYCKAGTEPHMLKTQYRMHHALCSFPSQQFYDDLLETDPSVQKKYDKLLDRLGDFWPQGRDCPLVFCNIIGEEEENHTGHRGSTRVGLESKRNTAEAQKIVEMVQVLKQYGVGEEEIAAITPYSAQKEEIKKQLERAHIEGVTVKTITDSQGSEFGIVLLSTVRTQPLSNLRTAKGERKQTDFGWRREHLGFITDTHQICVGITRCKYGLVIVGNVELLCHDPTWEALVHHCQNNECLVQGEEFRASQ